MVPMQYTTGIILSKKEVVSVLLKTYYKPTNRDIDKREQFLIDARLNKIEKSKIFDKSIQFAYSDVKRTIQDF